MEDVIRKLARSNYWQLLYARAKDLSNIRLFKNEMDFTFLQLNLLQYLEIYNSLYTDLYMKEKYISEEVIKDDLRTDAYLLYKSKKKDSDEKEDKKSKQIDHGGLPSIIFKSKSRKKK